MGSDIQFFNEDGKGTIRFSGEFTIAQAGEVKKRLLEAIDACQKLRIDLSEVENTDLTFIQLICAAHREVLLIGGKDICLLGRAPESINTKMKEVGYLKRYGCIPQALSSCLWERFCKEECHG